MATDWNGFRSRQPRQIRKYQRQWIRTADNKRRAWKRHLEKNPNDLQNKRLLTDRVPDYSRKK